MKNNVFLQNSKNGFFPGLIVQISSLNLKNCGLYYYKSECVFFARSTRYFYPILWGSVNLMVITETA